MLVFLMVMLFMFALLFVMLILLLLLLHLHPSIFGENLHGQRLRYLLCALAKLTGLAGDLHHRLGLEGLHHGLGLGFGRGCEKSQS